MDSAVLSPMLWTQLRALRHSLHSAAELSNHELCTSRMVSEFLSGYRPDSVLTGLGGHGVAVAFEGAEPGPTVLVRCELDALPSEHAESLLLGSPHAVHRCGHDGHMAVVAGLAPVFGWGRPSRGRVVLLFQPAEETGEGAARVLADPRFSQIRPDYALAFHNLPGYPAGTVVCRPGTFASASVGLEVRLEGHPSHAGEPEKGLSPAPALAALMGALPGMGKQPGDPSGMVTVTHAQLGEATFGIAPGYADLRATLRSQQTAELGKLCELAKARVLELAHEAGLGVQVTWHERFPSTDNDETLAKLLAESCEQLGLTYLELAHPFRWSEDFGRFADICPSLYFGIGIGESAPRLHQTDYAFNDEIIANSVRLFYRMVTRLLAPAVIGAPSA